MRQTAFTIHTPVRAGQVKALGDLLDAIGNDIAGNDHLRFSAFDRLHYAGFVVVADGVAEPFLVFEGNVDGPRKVVLRQMVERAGPAIDAIYRHCEGYPPAGAADARAVLAYLLHHDIGTSTFFVAWPGRRVSDICAEAALRDRIEAMLDEASDQPGFAASTPAEIRASIQEQVRADPLLHWAGDVPRHPFLVRHGKKVLGLLAAVPVVGAGVVVRSALSHSPGRGRRRRARLALVVAGLGAGWSARRLRQEEAGDAEELRQRDPAWPVAYAEWSDQLAPIVKRENVRIQNHLASVTSIKRGWFRLRLLELVLWAINLLARLTSNKGSLGGITSIHFARWVILPGDEHLIFLSNFDGSWESYLNDFIDLAAQGLTAVWTNTDNAIGFPPTRWLVNEGARDEARFKAYARYSQVPTRAWYSAYPNLTAVNIANNIQIREQLFAALDEVATEAWLRRL